MPRRVVNYSLKMSAITMKAVKCPTDELMFTNCAVVNLADFSHLGKDV
ncbi:hypothetical protein J437_LFUL001926, partial [Ladona fulva]